jgi:cytochrome c oxidase subunit 2
MMADAQRGQQLLVFRCGACHTVRGTDAGGTVAPDLTHLMSRRTIASATLANSKANLSGWVGNPQAIKPGTHMPIIGLSGPELADVRSYLLTLR